MEPASHLHKGHGFVVHPAPWLRSCSGRARHAVSRRFHSTSSRPEPRHDLTLGDFPARHMHVGCRHTRGTGWRLCLHLSSPLPVALLRTASRLQCIRCTVCMRRLHASVGAASPAATGNPTSSVPTLLSNWVGLRLCSFSFTTRPTGLAHCDVARHRAVGGGPAHAQQPVPPTIFPRRLLRESSRCAPCRLLRRCPLESLRGACTRSGGGGCRPLLRMRVWVVALAFSGDDCASPARKLQPDPAGAQPCKQALFKGWDKSGSLPLSSRPRRVLSGLGVDRLSAFCNFPRETSGAQGTRCASFESIIL